MNYIFKNLDILQALLIKCPVESYRMFPDQLIHVNGLLGNVFAQTAAMGVYIYTSLPR